jgi:two-component system chemotaxis response regulator CheB
VTQSSQRDIRVMVVDDSVVVRGVFGRIIDAKPGMTVATTAVNGRAAVEAIAQVDVDVVLLDVEMPEMDGLAALPKLLAARPGVRVIMASSLTAQGAAVTMTALGLGAADFVHKPVAKGGTSSIASVGRDLVAKIRALGQRTTGRQPPPRVATGAPPAATIARLTSRADGAPRVLAIASSTGGPNALAELLAGLPADFALPILVTQHMPPVFTALLAERLTRDGGRPCVEAKDGDLIAPGRVYIAPGDYHLTVRTQERLPYVRLLQTEPENHCRPAADPMFRSVATVFGADTIAVVLTGMGEDGRRGCEAIVREGGRVLVQDQESSVVWGMPGAVAEAGLASQILPLNQLAAHVARIAPPNRAVA